MKNPKTNIITLEIASNKVLILTSITPDALRKNPTTNPPKAVKNHTINAFTMIFRRFFAMYPFILCALPCQKIRNQ